MQIIEHPTMFHVKIDYNRFRVHNQNLVKAIGANFDWSSKSWVLPLTRRAELLEIQKKTKAEWVVIGNTSPQEIWEIPPMPDLEFEIDIVNRENGYKPRPYQYQGVARGLELKRFINGDEQENIIQIRCNNMHLVRQVH